ncbi:Gfo/Idh/MocA family protein [Sphingobacterium thalpophilum]|uniref:Gfo/Idh/MocA family protein n=1 Tax=Sphingobacterium thalpophilum TaxID=259 RepID=UPI0024A76205|nr:Gfo/Idh/MocA family oxidoreductase [Sphingobacterium thalpophilum]
MMNRKDFIRTSSILAAASFFSSTRASQLSDQPIRVGVIGVNGMGWSDLNTLLKQNNIVCTALCDIDETVLNKRARELQERNMVVATYLDYKQLLASSDVDAVIIATPDHWHCLQMVDAVEAGKHVYVEKPIGNSVRECQVMVQVAKKNNAIVQVGQWQRSQQHFKDAIDFVHSGKLGKIRLVKAWSYLGWKNSIPVQPDTAVPSGVHYADWLGPAVKKPFNVNRFHFNFRWFWDYAGGLMTDWGVHMLDYALLGMKVSDPKSVMASGGKFAFPDDAGETPDTMTAVYEFDGFNIQWEHAKGIDLGPYGRNHGVAFIGNNGTLVLNRSGWEVIPEKGRMEALPFQPASDNGLERHMANFVEAIRQRNPQLLHAPIEAGAHIAIFSQMGNIAFRTGQKLYWDQGKQRFTDSNANRYLAAVYHNGYKYPKI